MPDRFQQFIDDLQVGIIQSDERGLISCANLAACRILGLCTVTELIQVWNASRNGFYVVPDRMSEILQMLQEDEAQRRFESEITRQNGERLWISETFQSVRDGDGELRYYLNTIEDISEAVRCRSELEQARSEVAESTSAKTRFLAHMSHEMRTPLNGIIGMVGLLGRDDMSADQRDVVATIEKCAENLLSLVNEVLDYAKLDAGKLTLQPAAFDVNQLFEDLVELFCERAASKGIELVVRYLPRAGSNYIGDAGKLRQILVNLIGNAIKFTPRGSVVVDAKTRRADGDHDLLIVHILDSGVGVPPEARPKLFHAFSQVENSAPKGVEGTGLGLAICRQLVELMNGRIEMAGRQQGGSDFWFEMPLLRVSPTPEVQGATLFPGLARVLLVARPSLSRDSLVASLEDLNLSVVIESELEAVVGRLSDGDPTFRNLLVLIDIDRSDFGSLDCVLKLASAKGDDISPIVVLTERGQVPDPLALREAGVTACLSKPVKPSQLFDCLAGLGAARDASRRPGTGSWGDTAHYRRHYGLGTQRVLVVEDNPVNQRVAIHLLERLGFLADPVGNGLEAVEALKRVHYPVVLMDCLMPVMKGWEAAQLVRRLEAQHFWGDDSGESYIIGLVSGHDDAEFDLCQKAGMDDCLAKPVRMDELKMVMAQAVARVRSRTAAATTTVKRA